MHCGVVVTPGFELTRSLSSIARSPCQGWPRQCVAMLAPAVISLTPGAEEGGERAAAIRPSIIILGSSHLLQPSADRHGTSNINCARPCQLSALEQGDAGVASDNSSDHSSQPDVWLPDERHGADDDDAAAPDAGLGRHQAEAGHQLHDEPRQHGQLPRQGQEAAGGGGERPARGSQVVERGIKSLGSICLKSLHVHCSAVPGRRIEKHFLFNFF